MKSKLSLFLFCLLVGMSGAFTSCKNEAPDIFVKTADSHTSDFKGIVNAINDETKTVDDRLAYLVGALVAENLTLGEKLDLIEVAIQAGITTYEECAIMLLDTLDKLIATEEERLTAIHDILESSNASLVAKLAIIEASVQKGTATYKDCAQALIDAINAMNTSLDARLQAIYDILKANEATIDLKLAAIEAAIEKGTGTYKEYAQKLIDEIKLLDRSQAGKLQAIRDILESGLGSVSLKVEVVKVAVENGFITNQDAVAALKKAIVDQLKANNDDLGKSIDDITKAIGEIQGSIEAGFKLTNDMIDLIIKNLVNYLDRATTTVGGALDAIEASIKALSTTITAENKSLLDKLEELKQAVINGNDYSEIIAAIKALTPQPEPEPEPDPVPEGFVDLGITREMVYGKDCENPKKRIVFAEKNLGATKENPIGLYFRWGELNGWMVWGDEAGTLTSSNCVQYDKDGKATGNVFDGSQFKSSGWNLSNANDVVDFAGRTDLVKGSTPYGDAATYILGEGFRMMDETLARAILMRSGRDKWREEGIIDITATGDERGMWLINVKTNAKIFLPVGGKLVDGSRENFDNGSWAATYLWTTTPTGGSSWSYYQSDSGGQGMETYSGRHEGLNIRAVAEIN